MPRKSCVPVFDNSLESNFSYFLTNRTSLVLRAAYARSQSGCAVSDSSLFGGLPPVICKSSWRYSDSVRLIAVEETVDPTVSALPFSIPAAVSEVEDSLSLFSARLDEALDEAAMPPFRSLPWLFLNSPEFFASRSLPRCFNCEKNL
jgi:hypothetical protein